MSKTFAIAAGLLITTQIPCQAKLFQKDRNGSTHVNLPFIHVDREFDAHGNKHVKVRAPFVKVDNPPGENNARVSAPFTKVTHHANGTTSVKAPFTKTTEHRNGTTTVKAPFTKVTEHPNGTSTVKAPFVNTTK
ncbi:hypothetical protein BH10CYA1_BH10CYA1_02840 [soil metagenome]